MIKIKEVIVVEGMRDEIAVKRGIDAQVIYVSGFGISEKILNLIKNAQKKCGVILFMDSDFAGERIRKIISDKVDGVKHAYISREKSSKNGDVGVEYAKAEDIIESIKNAKCILKSSREEFTLKDLISNNLLGDNKSSIRRERVGDILGIGYCNGKKFLSRLNHFNITREQFDEALRKI